MIKALRFIINAVLRRDVMYPAKNESKIEQNVKFDYQETLNGQNGFAKFKNRNYILWFKQLINIKD